ncbi:ACT domain-containing protein [Artemisia annua]|uniref:ACT domain-containing protein n=1 Tax=Artemisia annua TaxID=35608 RepID=A0A2U1KXC6_ARTAN|nr:ACT domain-containing protein [Artemisia annua]
MELCFGANLSFGEVMQVLSFGHYNAWVRRMEEIDIKILRHSTLDREWEVYRFLLVENQGLPLTSKQVKQDIINKVRRTLMGDMSVGTSNLITVGLHTKGTTEVRHHLSDADIWKVLKNFLLEISGLWLCMSNNVAHFLIETMENLEIHDSARIVLFMLLELTGSEQLFWAISTKCQQEVKPRRNENDFV